MIIEQSEVHGEITFIGKELEMLTMEHEIERIEEISNKFSDLGERIEKVSRESEIVNRRE